MNSARMQEIEIKVAELCYNIKKSFRSLESMLFFIGFLFITQSCYDLERDT